MNRLLLCSIVMGCVVFALEGISAAEDTPSYTAYRVGTPIVVDGSLSDPAWQTCPTATGFRRLSMPSSFALKQTTFRAGWNDDALYLGIECNEPDMASIKGTGKNGEALFGEDSIEIFFAPDPPDYQQLIVNTIGSRTWLPGNQTNWVCGVVQGTNSWTAEIRIPFSQLGGQPRDKTVWRFNIARNMTQCDASNRNTTWAGLVGSFHDLQNFGYLRFSGTSIQANEAIKQSRDLAKGTDSADDATGKEEGIPGKPFETCYSMKEGLPQVDYARLLARNDLVYLAPATYPVEGMPLGCGNMGVVMWNQNGFDFQVNNIANWRGTSSGRIHVSNEKNLLNPYSRFEQRQSLAEGTITTRIRYPDGDLEMIAFAAEEKDLLVVHIRDTRSSRGNYYVDLDIWKEWGRASACMVSSNDMISITEKGNIADGREWLNSVYALSVATDVGTVGVTNLDGSTLRLIIPKDSATEFTVYAANSVIQSSSKENPLEAAARMLDRAKQRKWNTLWAERKAWWSSFWKESFVYLTSPDHVADYMENLWYLHLYWMASQSRGDYCSLFVGGNFKMNEDYYSWGNRYWYQNTRELFWALLPANHAELIAPFYRHYRDMLPVQREMTQKLFNVAGVQYEETMEISGTGDKCGNPYTCLYLTTGIEMSLQLYRHYLFTRDETFLHDMAYPVMKETSLFYLNWVRKEADGQFHVYPTNGKETYWRVKDAITDLAAIRRMFPILIAESRKLNVDEELRPRWQDVLDHLAPFPIDPEKGGWAPCVFLKDSPPVDNPVVEKLYGPKNTSHSMTENKNSENIACELIFPWELAGIGSDNYEMAVKTFHVRPWPGSGGWDQASVWAARLGLRDEASQVLRVHANSQVWTQGFWNNCAAQYWGSALVIETYFDSSGVNAMGTSEMLLQSHDGVIRVFPATPKTWSGAFSLRAQSGFKVFSEMERGLVHCVLLESLFGDECRLANPWPGAKVLVTEGKQVVLESDSALLQFKTDKDRKYLVQNANTPLSKMESKSLSPEPSQGPKWPGTDQWTETALADYLKQGGRICLGIPSNGRTPLRYQTARQQEKESKELAGRIDGKTNMALASSGGVITVVDPGGKSRSTPFLNDAVYGLGNITWIKQGATVVIDLGSVKKISGVYWSLDRQCNLTFGNVLIGNYAIEVSSDAKQWRQTATVTDNKKTGGRWDDIEPVEARYVRMVISPNQPSWRPRLGMDEMDVY